ncbi:hypothetical protein NM208_g2167 [Fusarium decemcellulare]|uniref:Uncharacterized protein n=1 Tax=Fusarium decemcellulare TaxID=57161 RepID=A0ACC1STJ4_9HYPO|nr:hypothetical protein NM208_g2167 [Fusarium decemcellulare]
MARPHPLHAISADEISRASDILKAILKEKNGDGFQFRFKNISIHEPPKALLLPYLDLEASGKPASERPYVPRCVDIVWTARNERDLHQTTVNLDTKSEASHITAKAGQHSSLDRDEMRNSARRILNDPLVLQAIKKLNLPESCTVQCDCWPAGADKHSTEHTHKYIQGLLYARAPNNHLESNQYAFPLPFSPLLDIFTDTIIKLEDLATGGDADGLKYNTANANPMAHCVENEYHPDLLGPPRKGLKPLHVVQPEGPSFHISDLNCVSWQKWKLRVGFNYREGLTLYDIRYDGRPMFYRLSISEMTVPYGDPRSPFHRKQAFDLGDAGAGSTANNLALGCDCLGLIHYFSGWLNNDKGEPVESPNVICLHEQDGGIGWKHTNHRTSGVAITRARNLVLQSILTVGNYEYIFAWILWQNGNIELETRATGILSTSLIDAGKTSPWGNIVSPGVLAANHQHLFSLRIDPMLDGARNSVFQEDSIAIPQADDENPHGNAWRISKTPFEIAGHADAAPFSNRVFKIVNENIRNPVSGNPVGFKLVPQPCQLLLAGPNSVVRKRARFAEHHVWVTRYRRRGSLGRMANGRNQSLEEVDGLADYAARGENVRNEDIVIWHTFGMTHNPRVEDFPVMPVEVSTISLKPADFFTRNPALDVPQSTQATNRSVLAHCRTRL